MMVTDPWVIFSGGCFIGGLVCGGLLGPLAQHYGSVKKAAFVAAILTFATAFSIGIIGVIFG